MVTPQTMIISIIGSVFASSGFWTLINYLVQRKDKKKDDVSEKIDDQSKMLLGLAYERIMSLSMIYIERKNITIDELANLHKYLYDPYIKLGGDGTAKKIMEEVDMLPKVQQKGDL